MALDPVTPPRCRSVVELAPLRTPDKEFSCCHKKAKKCNQCRFQGWCKQHKTLVVVKSRDVRWLDFDPRDNNIYCRVCENFGASQFKSQVAIRNMAHTTKRHAQCAAHQAAVNKYLGTAVA
jgi:hypothetical protein